VMHCLRAAWMTGKTHPKEYRIHQLEALCHFLDERQADIQRALCEDLHKPCFETEFTEVLLVRNELANALNNLCCWMKDENVHKNLMTLMDCAFIRKDPYGVVLIIAPYNYPIHFTLMPLVGAIAAGNCVVLKPSELSSCTERLLAKALPCYMDPVTDPEETEKLLENKFDYIFYTGNNHVAKIVMTAAAKHLTPLTLELGGKCPCYVDRCCNFQNVANRIVWGKCVNAGQTCIAPDYCDPVMQEEIFAPILPIFIVRDMEEAIDFINCRERPLAVYAFSSDSKVVNQVLDHTSSGGFCGNDIGIHATSIALPYGGIGHSGFGQYHGKFSFDTFTHLRGCLLRCMGLELMNKMRYPPYSNKKLRHKA
uniref:Aldehyde dehydrogenase domain-containing protein n=1 Tax=Pseudonaja textilis TaxID=8673 RepID=A0A670YUK1_PSETE